MRVHVLVEGPSEEFLLKSWLKRFLPQHSFKIIVHRGKGKLPRDFLSKIDPKRQGLLDQLPAKLKAYGKTLDPQLDRVLVLLDADDDDCKDLKRRLVECLQNCNPPPTAVFCIAVEETEAFYLGDKTAIKAAFPKASLQKMKDYEQDSRCGTWEVFQKVIGSSYEDKTLWAQKMGEHLGFSKGKNANKSPSFRYFCEQLLSLVGDPP